jgi:pimeloyl-ACP methyl ester carboxylesterase
MDVPPSRYRVIEKEGRLVVIDTAASEPGDSTAEPRQGPRRRLRLSAGPIVSGLVSVRDWLADFVLGAAVREWDNAGRAVIDWRYQDRNGVDFEWQARLDLDEQDRLGRALLEIATAPLLIIAWIAFDSGWVRLIAFLLCAPTMVWGMMQLLGLRGETNGRDD